MDERGLLEFGDYCNRRAMEHLLCDGFDVCDGGECAAEGVL